MAGLKHVRRVGVTLLGVVLLFTALFAASYAYAHQAHQRHAQAVLLSSERAAMARIAARSHGASCQVSGVQPGQLSGILSIPAINLQAPVEEGTDDPELNVAVGHDPQSVWPGVDGAAVFLAHDVSYFVHLNDAQAGRRRHLRHRLQHGEVRVTQPAGRPGRLARLQHDRPQPGPRHLLAAERRCSSRPTACWCGRPRWARPPRAPASIRARSSSRRCRPPTSGPSAPSALQAQGLTLEQNEAPMGTMNLVGASQAFAQSPGPLSLEAAALETYFGGLHALAQRQSAWWSALAPGVADAAPAGRGHRGGARFPARRGDRLGRREPEPGRPAHHGDAGRRLGTGPARHDGRSPCSQRCGDHRELEPGLSHRLFVLWAADRKRRLECPFPP